MEHSLRLLKTLPFTYKWDDGQGKIGQRSRDIDVRLNLKTNENQILKFKDLRKKHLCPSV